MAIYCKLFHVNDPLLDDFDLVEDSEVKVFLTRLRPQTGGANPGDQRERRGMILLHMDYPEPKAVGICG
jgi:hypothetical protein